MDSGVTPARLTNVTAYLNAPVSFNALLGSKSKA